MADIVNASSSNKQTSSGVDHPTHIEEKPPMACFTSHPALKLSNTIEKLKAPGPDSNYLEWSWVLNMHFTTNGVVYVVDPTFQNPEAEPTYYQDNQAVCSVIAQTIEPSNI
jgi:hypothetical protein